MTLETNPIIARYRKFIVLLATTLIEVVAVIQDAPAWLTTAAAVAGVILTVLVPNEPKYKKESEVRQSLKAANQAP